MLKKKARKAKQEINRKNVLKVWKETSFDCTAPSGQLVPVVRHYKYVPET